MKWLITGRRLSFSQPEGVSHKLQRSLVSIQGHSFRRMSFPGSGLPNEGQTVRKKRKPCRCNKRVDLYRADTSFEAKQVMMYTNPVLPTTQACVFLCRVSVTLQSARRKRGVGSGATAGILCSIFSPPPP